MTQAEATRHARALLGRCARALVVAGECRIYRRMGEPVVSGANWEQALARLTALIRRGKA